MSVPSGALAGAAVSASALAAILQVLAGGLALPSATATAVGTSLRRIIRVSAPRVTSLADVAAIGAELVSDVQAVARAATAGDASPALYAAAASSVSAVPTSASPVLTMQFALARALAASVEVACLGEAFVCEARTDFADRQSATAARARIAAAMDGASDRIAAALGQSVLGALTIAAGQTNAQLVSLAADLQPVVRVQTPTSVPSTFLAWELYGDPSRAPEIVKRNRVATPLFMPTSIEAPPPGIGS